MGRSPGCCRNPGKTRVRNWTSEEDKRLRDYIQVHGEGCWSSLPKAAGLLRCGKSCRLRWANHLRPHLKRGNFAEDEDELIMKLHALLGNKWSLIAGRLPGRTDNEIKNYWNVHLKRKLLGRGVDPQTHRPIQHQHQQHRHLSPGPVDLSSIQSQSVHDVSEAASGTTDDHPELNLELCIGTLASSHADQGNRVRADSSNDMESGGRTSAKDDLKVLIKPVCHRVDRLRPRTLLLLR